MRRELFLLFAATLGGAAGATGHSFVSSSIVGGLAAAVLLRGITEAEKENPS